MKRGVRPRPGSAMPQHATSTFTIDGWDEEEVDDRDGVRTARARVTKTFTGDLQAVSVTDLLMVTGAPEGNAAYVAVERVEGALHDRSGGFALTHAAHMTPAGRSGDWRIVPGSGTGDLAGIAGTGTVDVAADGTHTLTLDYELA